jgi:hypothetical protein
VVYLVECVERLVLDGGLEAEGVLPDYVLQLAE